MNWKLEWAWENNKFYGSDSRHFDNEDEARDFVKKLKKNRRLKITSAYLTRTIIII